MRGCNRLPKALYQLFVLESYQSTPQCTGNFDQGRNEDWVTLDSAPSI
jgi:hypothetical protein